MVLSKALHLQDDNGCAKSGYQHHKLCHLFFVICSFAATCYQKTLRSTHRKAGAKERIIMMGLSGGGWTTTLAAAVDPRIATRLA